MSETYSTILYERPVEGVAQLRPLRGVDVQVHETGQQVLPLGQLLKRRGVAVLGQRGVVARVIGPEDSGEDTLGIHAEQVVGQHLHS